MEDDDETVATMSEVNVVQGKVPSWWYDTCATVHVCYDRLLFKTYHEISDGKEIPMGNEGCSKVFGKENVELFYLFILLLARKLL